ncbi:MAG: acyl-CoA/acyl-ACP dehydrogenase [Hydrococcus sp. RU_2_2]|nr:acyl-CoA/acyl-ACP dehydrogenase [Hydrococcus sp. RU_2_2]
MGVSFSSVINEAETYLKTIIAPQATELDRDSNALKIALKEMGDRALLALRIPQSWGGLQCNEATFHRFQMLIARYSGALAFLQTQHQSAGNLIANSDNKSLKQNYLPFMGSGKILVGVGFSQLRRQGEPLMKATPVALGYRLDGEVPWITGFGFFQDFIIGATLPNGDAVYGIVPFEECDRIQLSAPMELTAMKSTNTVNAKIDGWLLARDRILTIKPAGAIEQQDLKNVLYHSFFALGCARAGLDIVEINYHRKKLLFLKHAFDSLDRELTRCGQAIFEALESNLQPFETKLQLRAKAINLAGRCTQAAVTASSGAANSLQHPAQRVYREALMFTVFGQTTAVMQATLEQLLCEKT